ncbi:MAG: hypothetical protein R6X33_16415 [Candidatus Brocadiia bacterium]
MCGGKGCSCQQPEKLKDKPENCSPEQIRECHGDVESHPCVQAADCENPEKLEGNPGDCSPEQIRECHGDVDQHPCA